MHFGTDVLTSTPRSSRASRLRDAKAGFVLGPPARAVGLTRCEPGEHQTSVQRSAPFKESAQAT
jgi:hypothetical protein